MLSWRDRRLRGEARRRRTPADPGPASAAVLLGAAVYVWPVTPSPCCSLPPWLGLAPTIRWGPSAPGAAVQDPGFLTVEWTGPAAARNIGVLIELEGSGIETVHAPGLDLYQSSAPGRHQVVVARSLRAGPLVQFRVPDHGQLPLYMERDIALNFLRQLGGTAGAGPMGAAGPLSGAAAAGTATRGPSQTAPATARPLVLAGVRRRARFRRSARPRARNRYG